MFQVGIVGRTGAGKSSLISALFRLFEPNGSIIIDGTRTSDLTLHRLRSQLSIIPQQPLLFTSTIRQNLDPYNKYTDENLINVLTKVKYRYNPMSLTLRP